ncbi:hypothetical protein [Gelidibacter gilvus]|uniref:Lipoprotein n=1 Tax=Gelidibacter gilvus TaxID=59602 RepID=A0A4Q0XD53_9FLAO|nr:hypothetical protein [Gelidibacter gilvus]RXJ45775.1 hypothetical protein ESZ48_14425 [Gelidibacter gilvus]
MKKTAYLLILLLTLGCSKSDDTQEEVSVCLEKNFLETFVVEPNDCFTFKDRPGLTFTFLGFEPYTKTHPSNGPHAIISTRLEEGNETYEYFGSMVYAGHDRENPIFSGPVNTGVKKISYTIFFDTIEFTETATQFIFHRATVRFGYYDSEFDRNSGVTKSKF